MLKLFWAQSKHTYPTPWSAVRRRGHRSMQYSFGQFQLFASTGMACSMHGAPTFRLAWCPVFRRISINERHCVFSGQLHPHTQFTRGYQTGLPFSALTHLTHQGINFYIVLFQWLCKITVLKFSYCSSCLLIKDNLPVPEWSDYSCHQQGRSGPTRLDLLGIEPCICRHPFPVALRNFHNALCYPGIYKRRMTMLHVWLRDVRFLEALFWEAWSSVGSPGARTAVREHHSRQYGSNSQFKAEYQAILSSRGDCFRQ